MMLRSKFLSPADKTPIASKTPRDAKTWRRIFWSVMGLLLVGFLYWAHYNPLLTDEEMIAHFNAHRADLEALVTSYREYNKPTYSNVPNWHKLPETMALMEKAGVTRVKKLGPAWHPDPYSVEAAKKFIQDIKTGSLPSLRPYRTVGFWLQDPRRENDLAFVLGSFGFQVIFKDLVHIPVIPRIEKGMLWFGIDPYKGILDEGRRIFPTLNEYPPGWKKGECVLRQIAPQWFIRLCIAAV